MAVVPYGYKHMGSSLFSEQKEAGLLVLYFTNSFCFSQSLGGFLARCNPCTFYCPHLKPSFGNTEVVAGHESITKFILRTSTTKISSLSQKSPTKNPTKKPTNQPSHQAAQNVSTPEDRVEQKNRAQPTSLFRFAVSCCKLSAHQ